MQLNAWALSWSEAINIPQPEGISDSRGLAFLVRTDRSPPCMITFNPSAERAVPANPLLTFDVFQRRPGWRTRSPPRTRDLLAPAADCGTQQQQTPLEQLCSLLAQHVQRSDSSPWTRSQATTTEPLQPSSRCRLQRTMGLFSGCCPYESPVSPLLQEGEICCCQLLHEAVPEAETRKA